MIQCAVVVGVELVVVELVVVVVVVMVVVVVVVVTVGGVLKYVWDGASNTAPIYASIGKPIIS